MRDLAFAYGNNRQAKKWVNKTISYTDLKEHLKVTIRTTESAEEYAKMGKAQRDAAKDHGGFVGGVLAGGRRKVDTVEFRSMIALASFLNEQIEAVTEYSDALVRRLIEKITVYDEMLIVEFKSGLEVEVDV